MERYCELNEITDGKLYGLDDWVKAGSNGCNGCSKCCEVVGESIILDPFDIYELTTHLHVTMQELLAEKVELHVVEGLILPNIRTDNSKGSCGFLDEKGRCTIHEFRPGFCRMFPLGRYYENGSFQYIMQVHECPYEEKTSVQVREWIGIPDMEKQEQYIKDWHYFILGLQHRIMAGLEEAVVKRINMYLLQVFFLLPYDAEVDFYTQFYQRFAKAKEEIRV